MMYGREKPDRGIVPAKSSNNAGFSAAEGMEGRPLLKGKVGWQSTARTLRRMAVTQAPTRLRRGMSGPLCPGVRDAITQEKSPVR